MFGSAERLWARQEEHHVLADAWRATSDRQQLLIARLKQRNRARLWRLEHEPMRQGLIDMGDLAATAEWPWP
jgi:hypothetical protein